MKIIFDGNNTALRCDHVSDLYNHQGKRVSAIYGVLDTLASTTDGLQDLTGLDTTDVIFVWDFGKSERRKKLWPDYKANRHKDLEYDEEAQLRRQEQLEQMDYLYEILPKFGVKSLRIKGEEADDLAYDLKCEFRKINPDETIIFITTDEDYLQLIDDNCLVWNPTKKKLITSDNFKEAVGVDPCNFIDYKVLVGDKSDNIPGVDGIGKVKSANFINKYKTIEEITAAVSQDKKLQKSTILSKFLEEDTQKTISIGRQMIDFKHVNYSHIESQIKDFLNQELHLDKTEVKKVIMSNQFTSILVKMNAFMRIFNDLEYNKYGEL